MKDAQLETRNLTCIREGYAPMTPYQHKWSKLTLFTMMTVVDLYDRTINSQICANLKHHIRSQFQSWRLEIAIRTLISYCSLTSMTHHKKFSVHLKLGNTMQRSKQPDFLITNERNIQHFKNIGCRTGNKKRLKTMEELVAFTPLHNPNRLPRLARATNSDNNWSEKFKPRGIPHHND